MNRKLQMKLALMVLGAFGFSMAEEAWILKLEYKNGQVQLLEKEKIQASLKKSRKSTSSTEYQRNHTSEFGYVLKDSTGQVIKTFEGVLPGKVHADFASEHDHEFKEFFTAADTFSIVVPSSDGAELEFFSRLSPELQQATTQELQDIANEVNSGLAPAPANTSTLKSIGKVGL